jgi:CheY-like chemotaxis protein
MPLISGWGFLELFEAINPLLEKQIDVIILTSSVNPADKERASNYKCVKGFFNKPFTEAMLKDILSSSFISVKK